MSLLAATKCRIATGAEATRAGRASVGLISPKRHMSGVALPKDLRTITKSKGVHLERHATDQSLCSSRSAPLQASASQQTRGFRTSPHVPYDSSSYTPPEVPSFFIKYKQRCTAPVLEPEHEELGLMHSLTRSLRSSDVIANTRRLKAKIPVEHHIASGHVVHPSGFVVSGPGHTSASDVARAKERGRNENLDRAMQTAAVAHRVLESNFEHIDATTVPLYHKVPFEVKEPDGIVKHPSGFVPPTPAVKFRYIGNMNLLAGRKVSAPRPRVRYPSPARAVLRAIHTETPRTHGNR